LSNPLAERVKERTSIVDIVGERVRLSRAGNSWKGLCPFHKEKSPSFNVSPDRGTYYCFGCGAKGDAISFLQEFEGLSFVESLTRLAERGGVQFDPAELGMRAPSVPRDRRERLLACLEAACAAYQRALLASPEAKAYVEKRGLTDETVAKFRVGFAPDEWRFAEDACKLAGFTEEEIEAAGITKKPDQNGAPASGQVRRYDRLRGRVTFPIMDGEGKVIGFSGRILPGHETDEAPKYMNSPETEVFKKSKALFGMPWARAAMRRLGFGILVEGQLDLVLAHQAGYACAVATSGTAATEDHFAEIARWTPNLVIAYDADGAGQKAAARAIPMALAKGMQLKVLALPEGKDPADLILESPEAWKTAVKDARHVVEFAIANAVKGAKDSHDKAIAAAKAAAPLIAALESPIEKAHFVGRLAEIAGVPEAAAWDEVRRAGVNLGAGPKPVAPAPAAPVAVATPAPAKLSAMARLALFVRYQRGQAKPAVDPDTLSARAKAELGDEAWAEAEAEAEAAGEAGLFAVEHSFAPSSGASPESSKRAADDFLLAATRQRGLARLSALRAKLRAGELSEDELREMSNLQKSTRGALP
jgi:DNA primase